MIFLYKDWLKNSPFEDIMNMNILDRTELMNTSLLPPEDRSFPFQLLSFFLKKQTLSLNSNSYLTTYENALELLDNGTE